MRQFEPVQLLTRVVCCQKVKGFGYSVARAGDEVELRQLAGTNGIAKFDDGQVAEVARDLVQKCQCLIDLALLHKDLGLRDNHPPVETEETSFSHLLERLVCALEVTGQRQCEHFVVFAVDCLQIRSLQLLELRGGVDHSTHAKLCPSGEQFVGNVVKDLSLPEKAVSLPDFTVGQQEFAGEQELFAFGQFYVVTQELGSGCKLTLLDGIGEQDEAGEPTRFASVMQHACDIGTSREVSGHDIGQKRIFQNDGLVVDLVTKTSKHVGRSAEVVRPVRKVGGKQCSRHRFEVRTRNLSRANGCDCQCVQCC